MESFDVFHKELSKKTVFLDRNVISPHYIPETLPHRDKEIERIMKTLAPSLQKKRVHNLFVYGKTGTGKTSCTKHVIERLMQAKTKYAANIDCVYVNCRQLNTKYQIILKLAEYCFQNEVLIGYPFSVLYEKVLKYVSSKNTCFIAVLDEIDKVKNVDDLTYALTRANDELKQGYLALIGITNNVAFKQELDPRSRSTLCEEEMVFPPYNAVQLASILTQRAELGFKPAVIEQSAINLAAALTAQELGDARYALQLLLKAGEVADEEQSERITDKHVQAARRGVEDEIVYELVNTLPDHPKLVLYAVALLTGESSHYHRLDGIGDEKIVFSGETYERYERLCHKVGKEPRSARWVREYVDELEMLGLITTTLSGKNVRGRTTLIRLAYPSDKIKAVVEKSFRF